MSKKKTGKQNLVANPSMTLTPLDETGAPSGPPVSVNGLVSLDYESLYMGKFVEPDEEQDSPSSG